MSVFAITIRTKTIIVTRAFTIVITITEVKVVEVQVAGFGEVEVQGAEVVVETRLHPGVLQNVFRARNRRRIGRLG